MSETDPEIITEFVGKKASSNDNVNGYWWKEDKSKIHDHVFPLVHHISTKQQWRRQRFLDFASLYDGQERAGWFDNREANDSLRTKSSPRMAYNVVQSVIDAAANKIAGNRPKPRFLTDNGEWSLQRKAERLTDYVFGVFTKTKCYETGQWAFVEAGIQGIAAVKVGIDDDAIVIENVPIEEVIIDDMDGLYKKPTQIHQRKYLPREQLLAAFPKFEVEIMAAVGGIDGEVNDFVGSDRVKVIESWHKKSSRKATDGKHAICIEGATLFEEEYDKDYFPIVFLRLADKQNSFWGKGFAETLFPIQNEIDQTLRNIQSALDLFGAPMVWIDENSTVNEEDITNSIGGIRRYSGTPPTVQMGQAMSGETYSYVKWLIQSSYELAGVSQMSASAKKLPGVDSAVAMRELLDSESGRFILVGQRYEQLYLDIARIVIDLSRDLYVDNKDLAVKARDKKFLRTIKWSEVDIEDDSFELDCFPVGLLPSTPAGKLQTVTEMVSNGMMDQETGQANLDFPDVKKFFSLHTATYNDTSMLIERMLHEGEYRPPSPYMNLTLAAQMTQSAYLNAETNNAPDDRLELLRKFIQDLEALIALANPQQAGATNALPLPAPPAAGVSPPIAA